MSLPVAAAGSLVKGTLCKMASGYLVVAAAGDNETEYLALETIAGNGTDGGVSALVLPLSGDMVFEALCSTTLVQATHVGNDYDLATGGDDVDLGATTDKVFHIDAIKSGTTCVGRFNKPAIA